MQKRRSTIIPSLISLNSPAKRRRMIKTLSSAKLHARLLTTDRNADRNSFSAPALLFNACGPTGYLGANTRRREFGAAKSRVKREVGARF